MNEKAERIRDEIKRAIGELREETGGMDAAVGKHVDLDALDDALFEAQGLIDRLSILLDQLYQLTTPKEDE